MTRLVEILWPETLFILVGTVLLAAGASFISPAGPYIVTGAVALSVGVALTLAPQRSR
ncbi:MAG TPA: hypothetical protein VMW94_10125 [Actinomycetes bacterium]|nr:hypothetical protein [Actinomycetes bacterium]